MEKAGQISAVFFLGFFLMTGGLVVQAAPALQTDQAMDVGNKFCPVSGDKVSGKHFVMYQGKKYGLCCAACKGKFERNPEKFIVNMEAHEAGDMPEETHSHHHTH